MEMTVDRKPPNWVLRSILAFIASAITVVALSVGTDTLLSKLGVFPPLGQPINDSRLLAIAFGYRFIYGVLGGYVIARLAPFGPMRHAIASGILGLVVSTIGAIAMWGVGPNWYPVALAITTVPCAWIGATLEERRHKFIAPELTRSEDVQVQRRK